MKEYLRTSLREALQTLNAPADTPIVFERPRQAGHGDVTTNIALIIAKKMGKSPRALAEEIVKSWRVESSLVRSIQVAGPGFINIALTDRFYRTQVKAILEAGKDYGRSSIGRGKKVQVEFVSANPTGPLTVGHGRGAVYGDTVARLYEWTGHAVEREYYFNNAGRQMRILGDSLRLRYLELLGDSIQFPEDYYQGDYIRDIARHLQEEAGDSLRNEPAEGKFKEAAEREIFADIRKTLKSLGVVFDSFYNENSLYTEGKIKEVLENLRATGLVYEHDGATWLKLTELGRKDDKVIVKSSGEPSYRLPDIAYHREKYRRGYDLMIDVLGADHIEEYPDVLAGIKAIGEDPSKVRVLINQFVTIVQDSEVVKMSTRKANFITLDELIDEVGADVVRYFFLMRTINSHLNFDLGLAKQHSEDNPVYYLQYAHARICSIFRKAEHPGGAGLPPAPDFDLLKEPEELTLIKTLLAFPETVEICAATNEPHRLANYLHAMAGEFHLFYHKHTVISTDLPLTAARLGLCEATRTVMRNGLAILGIQAPEQM